MQSNMINDFLQKYRFSVYPNNANSHNWTQFVFAYLCKQMIFSWFRYSELQVNLNLSDSVRFISSISCSCFIVLDDNVCRGAVMEDTWHTYGTGLRNTKNVRQVVVFVNVSLRIWVCSAINL